mgnify:CR=1 FL=1
MIDTDNQTVAWCAYFVLIGDDREPCDCLIWASKTNKRIKKAKPM